jgi:hypothetical protein
MPDSLPEDSMQCDVGEIIAGLPVEDRERLRAMPENELILLHHDFGMGLRNALRQNRFPALFAHSRRLVQESSEPLSFDAISSIAIREIWTALQKSTL